MYDVIIIGLGPAGSTLARLIGKTHKVLVLERRQLDQNHSDILREKSCGGLLAPDAQEMLAKFGLGLPKNVLVGPQLFSVRSIDMQNSIEKFYQRHYINIDRERFDRWMFSLIPDQVEIHLGSAYKRSTVSDNTVTVSYSHNGKNYTANSRVLVAADGAISKIRKEHFANQPFPKTYISIQEWFETDETLPFFSAIFDDEISDFYSWTIPKENLLLLGSALDNNRQANEKFELLKKKLSRYGFDFSKRVKRNGAFILRPLKQNQIFLGNDNIALIGETAGMISPSSAEGLSYAFISACELAKSLQKPMSWFSNDYHSRMKSLKRNILLKNIKCPCMYNSSLRNIIMKSGLKAMEIYQ